MSDQSTTADHPTIPNHERHLIGSVLNRPGLFHEIANEVGPEHFTEGPARSTWAALASRAASGGVLDPLGLCQALETSGELAMVGGRDAVLALAVEARENRSDPRGALAAVRESGERRMVGAVLRRAIERIERTPPGDLVDAVVRELAQTRRPQGRAFTAEECALAFISEARASEKVGHATGLEALDRIVRGFRRGELVVIGARPHVGKTLLCLQMAGNMAGANAVEFVSLEESPTSIGKTLLSQRLGIDSDRLQGSLSHDNADLFEARARKELGGLRLTVHDVPSAKIGNIVQLIRSVRLKTGALVFVVDNLSLIRDPATAREGRVQELASITRALKLAAREADAVVVVIAHLNREAEKAEKGKLGLHHLRDSGSVEQDADVVVLLEADQGDDQVKLVNARVLKRRGGRTGDTRLVLDRSDLLFQECRQ